MSSTSSPLKPTFSLNLLHPRHWLTWLLIGLFRLAVYLPFSWQLSIGKYIGLLIHKVLKSRRHIAKVNIGLCFPDKSEAEQSDLVRQVFINNGIGLMETMMAWFLPPERMASRTTFTGFEKVHDYMKQGRGVLLLGAHYSMLDLAGALSCTQIPVSISYRHQDNAVMNYLMEKSRRKYLEQCLDRKDIRGFIRTLKSGRALWYAQDQDYGRKNSVFVDFFGVPTATITATSRIARVSGAIVLPVTFFRKADNSGYEISIHDPLHIPSGDDKADAQVANHFLEEQLRQHPDQYLWVHKRFKTHPDESLESNFRYRQSR